MFARLARISNIRNLLIVALINIWSFPLRADPPTEPDPDHTLDDAAGMFLVTVFLGDMQQTVSYLKKLSKVYERVLTHFVNDDYCQNTTDACRSFQKQEMDAIKTGSWTKPFQFQLGDFSQNHGRNIGIYNFVRDVDLQKNDKCFFTMQITKVLNIPDFPMAHEISFVCQ